MATKKETVYPVHLPATIALHFKDKGLIELATKLHEIKTRRGFNTYADCLETVIAEFDKLDKMVFDLKRIAEMEREKKEKAIALLKDLKGFLDGLRTLAT